jgi:ureidoglycolate lyase
MIIEPQALSREAFAGFGDVIESEGATSFAINQGLCRRYHDLAALDLLEAGGRPLLSLFRSRPWPLPLRLHLLERHPLSSQAFFPLGAAPFLVVVAPPGEAVAAVDIRAFRTDGRQGVNFHRGVWHHPLIVLGETADFLVVDRGAPADGAGGENCDFFDFDPAGELLEVAL